MLFSPPPSRDGIQGQSGIVAVTWLRWFEMLTARAQPVHACATADRPANRPIGFSVFDTDLGHAIWWDGTNWVDSAGSTV